MHSQYLLYTRDVGRPVDDMITLFKGDLLTKIASSVDDKVWRPTWLVVREHVGELMRRDLGRK